MVRRAAVRVSEWLEIFYEIWMTTEFHGPAGHTLPIENTARPASAIADAQGVHLGEVIPLKIIAEPEPREPGNSISNQQRAALGGGYDFACATVADAMERMATIKNIPLPPEFSTNTAASLVNALDPAAVRGLANCEQSALIIVAATINRLLDIYAAASLIRFVWRAEGFDQLNPLQIYEHAQTWMRHQIANDTGDNRFRWPDTAEMAIAYFRARSRGPVRITMPAKQIDAVYFLDASACRRAPKGKSAPPAPSKPRGLPVPLVIRCPGLMGLRGGRMPDGRSVHRQPDGTVCTSWWTGGVLHRDPKEGPAWHRVGPFGERSMYFSQGKLHRDHGDGPAIIDTHIDGLEIHAEEYYQQGVLHRPATEGPALLDTDRSGRAVRELYYEQGKLHRDPNDGPARFEITDGYEYRAYHVRGVEHRDEHDGPAYLVRHIASGLTTMEHYIREGIMHRDIGPAWIDRDPETGVAVCESWSKDGEFHRDDGPAVILRDVDGTITREEFWRDGRLIADEPETVDA